MPSYVHFFVTISTNVLTTSSCQQFKAHTRLNKAPARLRPLDYAERNGYIRGIVKEIIQDAGRCVDMNTGWRQLKMLSVIR